MVRCALLIGANNLPGIYTTVEPGYKEPGYKDKPLIRKWFQYPKNVYYILHIKKHAYKEHGYKENLRIRKFFSGQYEFKTRI